MLPLNPFKKSVYGKKKLWAWRGSGRTVYFGAEGLHEKADTVPVIDEEKEKLRAHKTWYTSLYNKLFGGEYKK
jgi:hypothetical protein